MLTVARFIADRSFGLLSPASKKVEDSYLKHVVRHVGSVPLRSVTTPDVVRLQAALKAKFKPATVNNIVRSFKAVLNAAVDEGFLAGLPRWPKRLRTVELHLELTDSERDAFLAALPLIDARYPRVPARPILTVALETGLSRSDLLGLRKDAVDFDGRFIRVPRLKTGVMSTIPISPLCEKALRQAFRLSRNRHVFNVSLKHLLRSFERAKLEAGITRRLRFHDLRHSFGSNLARRGCPIQIISKAMGHADIAMTMRYSRVDEAAVQREVQAALELVR